MNPWQLKRLREQLKVAETDAELKACENSRKLMYQYWQGVATGLRDAQRMLGRTTYEPRRGTKDKSEEL